MIFIDYRVGSKEMMRYLPPQLAQLARLQFGDAMFLGHGPDGPLHIGIEVKALADMLNSIITGRFVGHQLPGLLRDYHVVYLILEGRYRPEKQTGLLQIPFRGSWTDANYGSKRWMHRDLDGFLTTMEMKFNVKVRKTFDRIETSRVVQDLHHWWTDKEWDEHHSAEGFDISGQPVLLPASVECRIAAQLKGIGWKRAHAVEKHFRALGSEQGTPPIVAMVLAPKEEWGRIPGIGKKTAAGVVEEIWRQKSV